MNIQVNVFRFSEVPNVVYQLSKLEVLLASDNNIRQCDAFALRELQKLATLDLQNNDICVVPPELGLCDQLRYCRTLANLSQMTF